MDHSNMDHSNMNHEMMNHGNMESQMVDHSKMDHSQHSNMMAMNHDEMMKMYFYFGVEDVQMLFKSWVVNSPKDMALSCLVMFLLTLFHEWLRVWRDNLVTKLICSFHNKYESIQEESQSDSGEPERPGSRTPLVTRQLAPSYRHGLKSSTHILLSVSYVLQQFISLTLMLVFMTYNLYLCLTVVFAAGLGFYLFAWKRIILSGNMISTTPDCH